MILRSHPRQKRLREHLHEHPLKLLSWSGVGFRSATLKHARSETLLDGKGALRAGGRWNAPACFRAVYLSLSPQTSVAEVFRTAGHYGFSAGDLRPRVIAAARVSLSRVVDLRPDGRALSAVCTLDELLGEDWRAANDSGRMALSQTLGGLLHQAKIEGFLVPSATGVDAGNLIVFNDHLLTDSVFEICEGHELDDWLKKPTKGK